MQWTFAHLDISRPEEVAAGSSFLLRNACLPKTMLRFSSRPLIEAVSCRRNAWKRCVPKVRTTNCYHTQPVRVDADKDLRPLLAIASGCAAGVILSIAGIGGGTAVIPILKRLTHLTQFQINATLLASLGCAGAVGAIDFWNHGCADLRAAFMLFVFSVPMTPLGIRVGRMLPDKLLTRLMGVACLCAAPLCAVDFRRELKQGTCAQAATKTASTPTKGVSGEDAIDFMVAHYEYAFIGAAAGFVTGAISMGGGWVQMLCLSNFSPLTQQAVIGTSLCASIPTNFIVIGQNLAGKQVHLRTAMLLALGATFGITIGANIITFRVDEQLLRQCFCGILLLASFDILRKAR